MKMNVNAVNFALSNYDIDYRIHKFINYSEELDVIVKSSGKKIYILDVSSKLSGLEIALKVREYDWDSIIIVVATSTKYSEDIFYKRLMVFDYVSMCNNYEQRLIDDIKMAITIIDKHKIFTFKFNHIIYRIPYNQITYIEKEPIVKRCIIHTNNNQYYITGSLNWIMKLLDENFCRTHQSCIVNLNNIKEVDLSNNLIIFKNDDYTDMLTAKMKKEVKKYVGVNK